MVDVEKLTHLFILFSAFYLVRSDKCIIFAAEIGEMLFFHIRSYYVIG